MGSRGVLFAITAAQSQRLLSASDDDDVMSVIEEIEEAWDEPNLAETDKAWDAIHRALTDGELGWDNGSAPLNQAILGGRRIYRRDDYIAVYKSADEVKAIDAALAAISDDALADRYRSIVPRDYAPEYGDEDRAYTVEWFSGVRAFYRTAAASGRSVLFTADQ